MTTRPSLQLLAPRRSLLVLLCWLASVPGFAQPELVLNQIIFDVQPLTPTGSQARTVGGANQSLIPIPLLTMPVAASPAPDTVVLPDKLLMQDVMPAPDTVERYLEAIAAEELDNGPFAAELIEQFVALGDTYQQQGMHEEALEAYGKAEYITRINHGLYSPEQFGIIESIIESHLATDDLVAANTKQQYLLYLQQQFHGEGSLEVVPALKELGDWNMSAFNTLLNRATPFALRMDFSNSVNAPPPRVVAFGNLYMAQENYYQAIMNLVNHREIDSPDLLELEANLIEAIFLAANRQGIMRDPDFYLGPRHMGTNSRNAYISFINGRNAWQRIRIYLENNPEAQPLDIAHTMIGLGDWHMLFNKRAVGLDYYREALEYLRQNEVPAATIDQVLSPPVPQQLPVFTPLPHSRAKFGIAADAPLDYSGHLDVSFRITRLGNVRDVQVLDKTANATPELEQRLKRLLRSAPFRPRIIDGQPAESDTVALRYYFAMAE